MINDYKTIIFDCDGVILNSNRVKREAYFKVALSHYGEEHATSLVKYLSKNTGNPREHFFNHFLKNIVSKSISKKEVNKLFDLNAQAYSELMEFSRTVALGLRKAVPCQRIGMTVIGLEVPHVHVHLIPLNSMSDATFTKKEEVSESQMIELARQIATKIE